MVIKSTTIKYPFEKDNLSRHISHSLFRGFSTCDNEYSSIVALNGLHTVTTKTPETGYVQKKTSEGLRGTIKEQNGLVMDSLGNIVQFPSF